MLKIAAGPSVSAVQPALYRQVSSAPQFVHNPHRLRINLHGRHVQWHSDQVRSFTSTCFVTCRVTCTFMFNRNDSWVVDLPVPPFGPCNLLKQSGKYIYQLLSRNKHSAFCSRSRCVYVFLVILSNIKWLVFGIEMCSMWGRAYLRIMFIWMWSLKQLRHVPSEADLIRYSRSAIPSKKRLLL